jgi:hypothetical protein
MDKPVGNEASEHNSTFRLSTLGGAIPLESQVAGKVWAIGKEAAERSEKGQVRRNSGQPARAQRLDGPTKGTRGIGKGVGLLPSVAELRASRRCLAAGWRIRGENRFRAPDIS